MGLFPKTSMDGTSQVPGNAYKAAIYGGFFFFWRRMDKKICVVCMSIGRPVMLTAGWRDNELIMGEKTLYPEKRRAMELSLLNDIREKEEKGFMVLVDEENSFITGRAGHRVRLRDELTGGTPVLVAAMNIYNELDRQSAVRFPRQDSGKFQLPQNIFDTDRTKDGEEFYRIDWAALQAEHVLTLLSCYATEYHNPASADYIRAMAGEMERHDAPHPLDPFFNLLRGLHQLDEEKVPQGELTGTGRYL